ncbi:MAG: cyclase [Chloroflexi bacterium]|nr:cyclase [Chloroflexota bacterium]
MTTTFVLHRVADYDAWRRVYDGVADMQREGGVTEDAVYRAEGDPNNVLVMHRFGSAQEAHSFFENPELRRAMQEAGVDAGTLRLEFFDQA